MYPKKLSCQLLRISCDWPIGALIQVKMDVTEAKASAGNLQT
jgi:hypothetical protein